MHASSLYRRRRYPGRALTAMLLLGALRLALSDAQAHGVQAERIAGGHGLRTTFDDGAPMAFAEVKIFAPAAPDETWQEGMTDLNGRFVFFPSQTGVWRMVVDDGMGHAVTREIEIDDAGQAHVDEDHHDHHHTPSAIIAGLGLIFGVFGLWALFRRRTHGPSA
jgi:hypothetical protein